MYWTVKKDSSNLLKGTTLAYSQSWHSNEGKTRFVNKKKSNEKYVRSYLWQ